MFESEQATKSRLQFISQLAGSAAGMSMLAACGGSGLVDSRGNPIAPSAGVAPGLPSLEPRPHDLIERPPLTDTPEFQKLMFKTDCRAVTRNGIAVIRDDLKSNIAFVNRINARLTLDHISNHKDENLSPLFLGDDGDDGGDYGPLFYPYSNEWPKQYFFGPTDVYGNGDWFGDVVFVGVYVPYMWPGATYYTPPSPRPNCSSLAQPLKALANEIQQLCNAYPKTCGVFLGSLVRSYGQYLTLQWAYRVVMAALWALSEAELLPLVLAVGSLILLWWLIGCPTLRSP